MRQLLTGKQMKEADRYSIREFGMEGLVLMERAALAVAEHILSGRKPERVFLLCGMGNNGADGLAAARILYQKGWQVYVLAVGNREKATDDWCYQKRLLDRLGVHTVVCGLSDELRAEWFEDAAVYVDALFGVGLDREVTGNYADAIELWNRRRLQCRAYGVSVDICSGVDAGTGAVLGTCVRPDVQITFGWEKAGQYLYPGAAAAGKTILCDIGFPEQALEHIGGDSLLCLERDDARLWLGRRCPWGNKGTFGRVLVIAGSEGMAGAAYLSAMAAYRTGAGLTEIVTPSCNRQILQQLLPEAVLHCYPDEGKTEEEDLQECACRQWLEPLCTRAQAIVIGPGLSKSAQARRLLNAVLALHGRTPVVIDADGLNLLAEQQPTHLGEQVILTPHPGELGRLVGKTAKEAASRLEDCGKELLERYGAVCVCKDARTRVLTPSGKQYCNLTGNSGMAVGGSGDVLTGVIAALAAQGMEPWKAAVLGVWLHGAAGDEAARVKGSTGMIAGDLPDQIAAVLLELARTDSVE